MLTSCEVINFEINLIFPIIHFFISPNSQDKNLNILRTKIAFKMKQKAFFIILKRISLKQIKQIYSEGENPTLNNLTDLNMVHVMRCTIWYHLYNLKNMENIHGGVLLLVKLQASCNFTKGNTPPWIFFTFFKLYKWY